MAKWMCTMCGGVVDGPPPDHHEDHACDWIDVTLAYRAGREEIRDKLLQKLPERGSFPVALLRTYVRTLLEGDDG